MLDVFIVWATHHLEVLEAQAVDVDEARAALKRLVAAQVRWNDLTGDDRDQFLRLMGLRLSRRCPNTGAHRRHMVNASSSWFRLHCR